MRFRWIACGLVLARLGAGGFALLSAQQTQARDGGARSPTVGTATISGTVVADDAGHAPIRHATLTLATVGSDNSRTVASDDQGRFIFADLPADTFVLEATKGAYLLARYGAVSETSPGVPIPLRDGQSFVANPIVLTHGSVITGRVTGPSGQPVQTASVRAMRFDSSGGDRQPRLADFQAAVATPDSRGIYRLYGLPAGDYLVLVASGLRATQPEWVMTAAAGRWLDERGQPGAPPAVPPQVMGRPVVLSATYFPGTTDIGKAGVVTVGRAEERQGIDIVLARIGSARVSGVVYTPTGQPAAGALLVRTPKQETYLPVPGLGQQVRSGPDGRFTLTGVPAGEYTLSVRASSTPGGTPTAGGLPAGPFSWWGQSDLVVAGDDLDGVAVHLQLGMTVSGTVAFDGATAPPADLGRYRPTVASLDRSAPTIVATTSEPPADPTFKIEGLTPGSYGFSWPDEAPGVGGSTRVWTLRSLTAGGRDLLDGPLEIRAGEDVTGIVATYSDRHTELTGHLVNQAGQPASQFQVLVFPTDQTRWASPTAARWRALVRASVEGSFRITGLPSGEYYVCALTELDPSQHLDTAFLGTLTGASLKVTLAEGVPQTQTFRLGGGGVSGR